MSEILSRWGKEINGTIKSFTRAESHFADVRLFEEDDTLKETMLATITFAGKCTTKNVIRVLKEDAPLH